jgi:hypothetical protein
MISIPEQIGSIAKKLEMPIPGKKVGEITSFDFPYFANSRVMALEAKPLSGIWRERIPQRRCGGVNHFV